MAQNNAIREKLTKLESHYWVFDNDSDTDISSILEVFPPATSTLSVRPYLARTFLKHLEHHLLYRLSSTDRTLLV